MVTKKKSTAHSDVAFIAFSDIQIEDWKQHSTDHSRLYDNKKILLAIKKAAQKYNVPALFCGDIFDNPKSLSNLVIQESFRWFKSFTKTTPIYAIHGNHDQSEQNSLKHSSPNYISTLAYLFKNFNDVSHGVCECGEFILTGIPFLSGNNSFEEAVRMARQNVKSSTKKKILLIHSDLPNAKDPSGFTIESSIPTNLNKLFKGFDLVLCGHIHKPQILRRNIIILGATHQQRVTDSGTDMGYWIIYKDLTYKFIPLKKVSRFIYLDKDQEPPDDKHFYIKEREVTTPTNLPQVSFATTDPKKLATRFLKVKKIKSKAKRRLLIKYLSEL